MIKVHLTKAQRQELENSRRQASGKDSEKALMILMNADGKTAKEIAQILKRNPHTVRDWLKRYKAKGISGLRRKFSPGRPDEKRKQLMHYIETIISESPSTHGYIDAAWTVPLITYHVNERTDISTSRDTVVRALKDMGYSYKRPSKTVPGNAPPSEEKRQAIEEIVRQIETMTKKKDCLVYALDEAHFSTEPYLVQGWFKKRWPPQDSNQQEKRKSHVLWMLEFNEQKILLEKIEEIRQ